MSKQDPSTGRTIKSEVKEGNWCYYYLHENGELIHKRNTYDTSDFEDSDLVLKWWRVDLSNRADAYNFLIAAKIFGANQSRINELIKHWDIANEDAENYCKIFGLVYNIDGNQYVVHGEDFANLQESTAGFGDTLFEAITDFYVTSINQ